MGTDPWASESEGAEAYTPSAVRSWPRETPTPQYHPQRLSSRGRHKISCTAGYAAVPPSSARARGHVTPLLLVEKLEVVWLDGLRAARRGRRGNALGGKVDRPWLQHGARLRGRLRLKREQHLAPPAKRHVGDA